MSWCDEPTEDLINLPEEIVMFLRKTAFLIVVLVLPLRVYSQDILNPLDPKEMGSDILQYMKTVDKIYPADKSLEKLHYDNIKQEDFKQLLALAIFSRLNNPYEYETAYKNLQKAGSKRLGTAKSLTTNLFLKKERYKAFEFSYKKYWLMDLYWAPFVFVGTITKIDTMCYALWGKSAPVIRLELSDIENVNKYYETNVQGKKIEFILSTAHRAKQSPSWIRNPQEDLGDDWSSYDVVVSLARRSTDFTLGGRYLVFLTPEFGHSKCLSSHDMGHLPYLYITALGSEGFPVEHSELIDVNQYFGQGERINLSEAKTIINSVMDEISKWRRE